jgi:hypothetical protein
MFTITMTCNNCGTHDTREFGQPESPQWWHLRNYYGITGTFCPSCYDQVSHGTDGHPLNPGAYTMILIRQAG